MLFQPTSNILVPFMQPQFRRGRFTSGGGGAVSFFDTFTRADADALGNNSEGDPWVEQVSDTDIVSNAASLRTGSFAKHVNVAGTALTGISGYMKASWTGTNVFPLLGFRYTNSSSPSYAIQINDDGSGTVQWTHHPTAAGSSSDIGSPTSISLAVKTLGMTWELTGAATVIRLWANPTNNTTAAVDGWDSGGDTADATITTDPGASAVDTGTLVWFGGYQGGAGNITFDNIYVGDIP
jgi:hypothetical protein